MHNAKSRVRTRAEVFRALAARQNQTLDEFARTTLNIERRYFYRILNGTVLPGPTTREAICERLGLSFDDLFVLLPDAGVSDDG